MIAGGGVFSRSRAGNAAIPPASRGPGGGAEVMLRSGRSVWRTAPRKRIRVYGRKALPGGPRATYQPRGKVIFNFFSGRRKLPMV